MKEFVLDAELFSNKEEFLAQMGRLLAPELPAPKNLDALCDVLRGGFGPTKYGEPLHITWKGFAKSRRDFDDRVLLSILVVMLAPDMGHDVKLNLA